MFVFYNLSMAEEDDVEDSYIQSHLGHKSVSTTIYI